MVSTTLLIVTTLACACAAQYAEDRAPRYIASEPKVAPTPVPILKQINRHNEDGSYTYGFEAADGSFKIETKEANGEVRGKYGYTDDTGKVRVVEYGANKHGFQPVGEGITVAPPTLVDETAEDENPTAGKQQSQYRAQQIDYDYEQPAPRPRVAQRQQIHRAPKPRPAYQAQQQDYQVPQPAYQAQQPSYQAQQPAYQAHHAQTQAVYQQSQQPAYQQQTSFQQPSYRATAVKSSAPVPPKPAFFAGAAPSPARDTFFTPAAQSKPQKASRTDYNNYQPVHTQQFLNPQTSSNYIQDPQPRSVQSQPPFSMLDQLLKQYALPQGGAAPLHDITFGSF